MEDITQNFSIVATRGGKRVPLAWVSVQQLVASRSYYEHSAVSSQQPVSQPENITRLLTPRPVVARKMQRRVYVQCDENEKEETKGDRGKMKYEAA
jgi:hypothetical protein